VNRLLLDQGLPYSAATLLRQAGWNVVHVSEIGMSRASDADILQRARAETRACVSHSMPIFIPCLRRAASAARL
jgi:predicted nuclease of predicted toxin-antitoxin system